ncbi:hypothetical protein Val02_14270 [Virgisporangium aliadipatigenens]|uniref:LLM class flavin-dependent oxidoreductase n=1 Tax=Virgisporangium aliadipatigenens TaxID=741659 RepID=A0A8J3YIG3_9ACTN|nr:LLM class flavin-dependent oxidoreductase [Virgisporangium aliadipatigenens]GIJ44541.1 hypothetical protein Val02_14270 [Virgisporangium aliadipatigenens]
MNDYGHDLLFGTFVTPVAGDHERVVALAQHSERAGLDLVTFQDHPYQAGFLDTWTLLSFVAAATTDIRLSTNVLNLPLRQPIVIARSVASLDLLSGGRIELGLGAGSFWDAIEANGGRRLSPGESVDALEEAIRIIRDVWTVETRGGVRVPGTFYRVNGAKRGPAPAHPVAIWLGAYKPRMLHLVGRVADGWLPSLSYLPKGGEELAELNAVIDEAATQAGREPRAVRRLLNIGPDDATVERLTALALEHGVSAFILSGDDPAAITRFGQEIAPKVRENVDAARNGSAAPVPAPTPEAPRELPKGLGVTPTPDDGTRLTDHGLWDEAARPQAPAAPEGHTYPARAKAVGQHLVDVHDHLRQELAQVRDVLRQVEQGTMSVGRARGALQELTLRQNNWTLGAFCASYCTMLTQHHSLEDSGIFPHLKRADPGLAPVIDRLEEEHVVIHHVVENVDRQLVELVRNPGDLTGLRRAVDTLTDTLLSHLSYEERNLVEPLARLGFYPGQV